MAAGKGEPKSSNGKDGSKKTVNGKAPANTAAVNLKAKVTGLPSSYCLEVLLINSSQIQCGIVKNRVILTCYVTFFSCL